MSNPITGRDGRSAESQPSPPAHAMRDEEMALALPDWDLLPPAEFVVRHVRR